MFKISQKKNPPTEIFVGGYQGLFCADRQTQLVFPTYVGGQVQQQTNTASRLLFTPATVLRQGSSVNVHYWLV